MKSVALLVQEIISIEVSRGPTRPPGLSRVKSKQSQDKNNKMQISSKNIEL